MCLATPDGMKHPACVAAAGSLGLDADGEGGIVVRGLGLWLDPPGARPAAFVSHAHALQALGAGRVLASPETLVIARALGLAPGALAPLEDRLEREAHLGARRAAGV